MLLLLLLQAKASRAPLPDMMTAPEMHMRQLRMALIQNRLKGILAYCTVQSA
jgi:hypothetical protein